jgi:hypothetical protein
VKYDDSVDIPSPGLVDGRKEQPNCIDLDDFTYNTSIQMEFVLKDEEVVKNIKLYFISEGKNPA